MYKKNNNKNKKQIKRQRKSFDVYLNVYIIFGDAYKLLSLCESNAKLFAYKFSIIRIGSNTC